MLGKMRLTIHRGPLGAEVFIEDLTRFCVACFSAPNIADVISALRDSSLEEAPYQGMAGIGTQSGNFPAFDQALWFMVRCPCPVRLWQFLLLGGRLLQAVGPLELLVSKGQLLQAGYALAFPRAFFTNPSKKGYARALSVVVSLYGQGVPMPYLAGEGRLFNDAVSHCYIAQTSAAGNDALVLRVGDRALWDAFAGIA